jgi:hypothetical protein
VVMATCSAKLSPNQRRMLRTLLAQESEIAAHCSRHISQFSNMINALQLIHHEDDLEKRAAKCNEFIHMQSRLDDGCMTTYEMVPGAVSIAMTCSCICIQAACFRMLYKWIPKLDVLRMKLLKIKSTCEKFSKSGSKTGIELCANIEKTAHNVIMSQTTSH